MKFSLLLPTLGTRENEIKNLLDSLKKQTYKNFELIIVSQGNHKFIDETLKNYKFDYKHITMNEKGISKARNRGIPHITGDIMTLADDDGWYDEKAFETVKKYIEEYDPDIACFKHYDPDKKEFPKKYPEKEILNFSKSNVLRQSSFDVYVNIKNVSDYKIGFDERFGVGGTYNSGEENIYLMDLYNLGYKKMCFFPEVIAYHPNKDCNYLDEKSFMAKGPLFRRLFGFVSGFPIFIAFGLKKRRQIDSFWRVYFKSINEFIKFK
ncbi:family 2 glycosyl transferase [[Clostridium] sordellii]|uniref:glycosyltransferase family 2 protein n=1 Tax=Paraclostridium sordellii TaxID=1505 RepID=UPI0005E0903F|nr:glycosyltransferase family 2 protein [Paeniclostridium sordellii]MDU2147824.1 glycosyltransferase family 2 protein [Paeniclostridium sordellii]CEN84199.1 family 2 glycosyl transferase [[Clostridium] sordellii] [Paeniclostridium sordellii]CEN94616.1 family 2 glycosyl transferase [[Clostridium] sordellii] [Paeniclostridium sordellii]CEN96626.1 family 2 glycosyl transferase [[Clostridium] sordellii] [Paeniclostridium sordellii]CEQ23601.1 family 2 glycosyl transferase [[Clostridium] sordellii] 